MGICFGKSARRRRFDGQRAFLSTNIEDGNGTGTPRRRRPPPPTPPSSPRPLYVAKYDYSGRTGEDLSFEKGDVLEIVDDSENWWLARLKRTGEEGYVPRNYVALFKTVAAQDWFFGKIRRVDAERYIQLNVNGPGSFLIRHSESQPGNYALSVKDVDSTVKHYRIRRLDNGGFYIAREAQFPDLPTLIEHYRCDADGLCASLRVACVNPEQPTAGPDPRWEIPRDGIAHVRDLGRGQFGDVFEGRWNGTPIAVKTLRTGRMKETEFLAEAEVMKKLQHPKLVQLYGVCTVGQPIYIVMELVEHGALLNYLRSSAGKSLGVVKLIDIGAQVACGMAYLESQNFIHRDLAARNVLLGKHFMCKITDFGMARFAPDFYSAQEGAKFPIKWTAPEAALYQTFTVKSDVWSFGIFLTELVTGGAMPYPGKLGAEVLALLEGGYRIPKPRDCPERLYEIMMTCWHKSPDRRPTFETLQWSLEEFFANDESAYKETTLRLGPPPTHI